MPPIPAAQLTPDQRAAVDEIVAGPRGALIGPFVPTLRSPELMRRLQRLGEYLRYDNALGPRHKELAILLTAAVWSQNFEWHVHRPMARDAGISDAIVDAIAEGRQPQGMTAEDQLVYDFFQELLRVRTVSDDLYARVVQVFGERGVIDLVTTIGYYSTLAMIMNVARTPVPDNGLPAFRL